MASPAVIGCAGQTNVSSGLAVKFRLENPACPTEATWVELELVSQRNKEKLRQLLDHSGRARVVFEGEFYGSGVPDPKLPQAIAGAYHPGLGPPRSLQNETCRAFNSNRARCGSRSFTGQWSVRGIPENDRKRAAGACVRLASISTRNNSVTGMGCWNEDITSQAN